MPRLTGKPGVRLYISPSATGLQVRRCLPEIASRRKIALATLDRELRAAASAEEVELLGSWSSCVRLLRDGPGLVFRRSDAKLRALYRLTVNVALTWTVPVYPEYVTTMVYVCWLVIAPESTVQL
jgi:hypothetical protein